mgnify:CR=1 FL=1
MSFDSKRQKAFDNDGLKHFYFTCPECRSIVSDEDIVWLDGEKMCRQCLLIKTEKK